MSEDCSNNCGTCTKDCPSRRTAPGVLKAKLNGQSKVKKVIAVVSGKGGVGKSSVTAMLAVAVRKLGFSVAILDADITGPSIPKAFGIREKAKADNSGIYTVKSKTGISIMSVNLLLKNETDPVVWRAPIISGRVRQFWTDVIWGDVDFMFIDMPPGTGDVPLTVFQSIPVDGIVVVTSPQGLVSMIVSKAIKMARLMKIPIMGLVENMSFFKCPDNGKEYKIFGESHIDEIAEGYGLEIIAKLPINPQVSKACDDGNIELCNVGWFDGFAQKLAGEIK